MDATSLVKHTKRRFQEPVNGPVLLALRLEFGAGLVAKEVPATGEAAHAVRQGLLGLDGPAIDARASG